MWATRKRDSAAAMIAVSLVHSGGSSISNLDQCKLILRTSAASLSPPGLTSVRRSRAMRVGPVHVSWPVVAV